MSDLIGRDRTVTWHPFTQHGVDGDPMPVVGARGARLQLADGRELVDGISSWWATLHGHGEPRLVEAIERQYRQLDHVLFAGTTHEPAVRLAERLVEKAPEGLTRVFFSDNGSTAIEVALKMVVQRWVHLGEPQRTVFVALEGGYHGDTFGAMAVGDPDPFFEPFKRMLFEVRRIPIDTAAAVRALDELGDRAAGVILEPRLMGAAGMRIQPTGFVGALRQVTARRGVPLIADEVMTGFGRTGHLFACQGEGVAPDLMCLAKGLTGGMFPMSVTLAREEFFEAFLSEDRSRAFFHGHTFTAHPVGCAVALASLDLIEERHTPALLARLGARLHERLAGLATNPRVSGLRRVGGAVAFELAGPEGQPHGYLSNRSRALREVAQRHGALLRPLGDTLYALPPACTTDEELETLAVAFEAMVDSGL